MTKRITRNDRLEEAIALLIQNQAMFMTQVVEMNKRLVNIEGELATIKTILVHHERILENLPEAIREKIGFKAAS